MTLETILFLGLLSPLDPGVGEEADGWLELDREIATLVAPARNDGDGPHIGGFMVGTYATSGDPFFQVSPGTNLSGFDMRHVRPIATGAVGKWNYEVSADAGSGSFQLVDAFARRDLGPRTGLTWGMFKQPLLHKALVRRQNLLFFDRSNNGEQTDERDLGAMLDGNFGVFRWMLAAQNGIDDQGDEMLLTGRVTYDVLGQAFGSVEGRRSSPERLNMGFAIAGSEDSRIQNGDYGAAEFEFSSGALYASADIILYNDEYDLINLVPQNLDNDEVLMTNRAGTSPWGVTLSWLFGDVEQFEAGIRLESFDDLMNTGRTSLVINWYDDDEESDHSSKWQLVYQDVSSDDNAMEGDRLEIGYTISASVPD